jgi:phage major head subunit gpT-like protein
MAIESRAKWTDLIPEVGLKIREVYDQGDDMYTPGIHNLLNVTGGVGAQQNYSGKTSFGKVKEFEDGDNIPSVDRYKTYTTSINYVNLGGAVEVTKNQIEDRDFNRELDEMKDLSRSNNYGVDESGVQLFNGGFATTTSVNGYSVTWYNDDVPQFSTVHPTVVPGASTQSNASATGITLGHDNLEIGRLAIELQQQDNGLALAMAGRINLVTPINLEKTAMETIGSDLTPESANNAINVFRGSMNLTTCKFLDAANGGSNTQWFLIMDGMHKLYHETRQEKRLELDKNIRNKVVTFTVDSRWSNHSLEWKGTWGSQGDGAAYSS